jgi:16S rRNA (guanine527-N7)-methyltransferase
VQLLQKWQRAQRLVGSSDTAWIVDHIILDSLLFTRVLPPDSHRVLDVGSGAGVPGVPLKVVLPETAFTLLDARAKRISFLSTVVRELAFRDCEVLHARVEDAAMDRPGRYDAVVMRCAGDPVDLQASVRLLLRRGGVMIASGPPDRRGAAAGHWREIDGPFGRRRFWIAQET